MSRNLALRYAIAALFLYALVIPLQLRAPIDGDEPFYLLVTESIVHDHDLDLANQYRDIARSDIGRPDLIPQPGDPVGKHGEQYSRHEPFLPLLLVPGYVLFGIPGALATIALFGVLLVRSLVRWFEDEGIPDDTIRRLLPLIVFGPPIVFYAARIWPEVPAAFCFVEAVRGVRQQRAQRWIPALFALVMLKLRFLLIGVALVPFALRGRHRKWIAIAAAILALPLLVVWLASGSATNVHTWRELIPMAPMLYVQGLFGLLLDGAAGIAFQAPIYLLGIFALTRWRSMPEGFRLGATASLLYVLALLPRSEWHGGWSPPLRYIVVFLPVLALGAAAMYERAKAWMPVITLWTVGVTLHGMREPWRLFHIANGENAVGEWLSAQFHSDFSRLFPSYIRPNCAAIVAAIVLIVAMLSFAAVSFRAAKTVEESPAGRRRTAPPAGDPSTALGMTLAAFALVAFFHFGKLPGNRIEFEDAHVTHNGGTLYPYEYQVARFLYRGGWMLKRGDSLSFLASRGSYILFYASSEPATIDIGGHAFHLDKAPAYAITLVDVPQTGRVTLRCIDGSVNLDRMDRHD